MNRCSLALALVSALFGFALAQFKIDFLGTAFAEGEHAKISTDDSNAVAAYANFCRVTGTPEEVILDFGLNPQPFGTQTKPVAISHRIVCNFYTAKRFNQALAATIQRYEKTFGELETDVQKRVKAPAER
jgi:hypothetical protein